jgi:hypothetical protein
MTKIRQSTGGAYERRGAFFMRVTIAPQRRTSEHLPWCTSLEDAQARANAVQGLPSVEARLLAGRDANGKVVVPLPFRALYGFLHREGMRKGEARALDWASLDLSRGTVDLDENKASTGRASSSAKPTSCVLGRTTCAPSS